jgi:hypothetical protein
MKLYFKSAQIPELEGLTRQQRKAVFQCALEAFYFEDRSRVFFGTRWILAGILCGAIAGWGLDSLTGFSQPKLLISLCGLAGLAASIFFAQQAQTKLLRPYLRRVIDERKEEIARLA